MTDYLKRMIDEHANLIVRTTNLHNYIYSDASDNDDKVEFANKCIQLRAMKQYEEALRARLENAGIYYDNGTYAEKVAEIKPVITPPANTGAGSDYDIDNNTPNDSDSDD